MLKRPVNTPVLLAAAAHVLAWAAAALWINELRAADDLSNTTALIAICSPVPLSGLALVCALTRSCRQVVWAIAIMLTPVVLLGVASIGIFLAPSVGLLYWTASEMSKAANPPDN